MRATVVSECPLLVLIIAFFSSSIATEQQESDTNQTMAQQADITADIDAFEKTFAAFT